MMVTTANSYTLNGSMFNYVAELGHWNPVEWRATKANCLAVESYVAENVLQMVDHEIWGEAPYDEVLSRINR